MRIRLVTATLLIFALVASVAVAASPDTKKMVLGLSDLPADFTLDKGYYASNARAARESKAQTLAQFNRWGRVTGYVADFSRDGLTGILFIESAASTYRTAKGAADSTHGSYAVEGKTQLFNGQPVVFKRVSMGGAKIGYEARMFSVVLKHQGVTAIVYAIVWRYAVVKASVLVDGLSGTVGAAQVVALARKQQARIAAATR